jgi:Protein of unknown function (DUF3108)
MRAIATLLATMGLITAATARASDAPTPHPFVATYAVSYRGLSAGNLTFKFTRDQSGRYVYETHADPSALASLFVSRAAVERSVMEIGPDGVRPLDWSIDNGKSGTKGDGSLHFDWDGHTVTGTVEGEPVTVPTEAGLQDRSSLSIAVTTQLMRGIEPGTVAFIDNKQVKRYTYTRKEDTKLDSPLGKLDTLIYESTREGSSRLSRFWIAPSLEFLPARAEQVRKGKVETVMVLTSYQRL